LNEADIAHSSGFGGSRLRDSVRIANRGKNLGASIGEWRATCAAHIKHLHSKATYTVSVTRDVGAVLGCS
jgi:hypothetical protein